MPSLSDPSVQNELGEGMCESRETIQEVGLQCPQEIGMVVTKMEMTSAIREMFEVNKM